MANVPNYPGNSDTDKLLAAANQQPTPERREVSERKPITKVTTGAVVQRKKGLSEKFAGVFFGPAAKAAGDYILNDVLIPALKDTITNMVKTGIEVLIYGEAKPTRSRDGAGMTRISYDTYYDRQRGRNPASRTTRREPTRLRSRYDFEEFVFDTRGDADTVLGVLDDALRQYPSVTVAEFFDAAGIRSEHVDEKYGWENLAGAGVCRVRDGYILDLPAPIVLE